MKLHSLIILTILATGACTSITKPKSLRHSKIDKRFLQIDTTVGTHDVSIDFIDKQPWNLRMIFPESTPRPKTLIIALHWAGGGDSYQQFSNCLVAPAFANNNNILLIPDAENRTWFSPQNKNRVLTLVRLAIRNWHINPDKIVVMGYSNGGNGTWFFAENYPNLFRLAIPMASAYPPTGKEVTIPMYVIHGVLDELFDINRTRVWVETYQKQNDQIIFQRVPTLSHRQACQYLPALKEAEKWLIAQ